MYRLSFYSSEILVNAMSLNHVNSTNYSEIQQVTKKYTLQPLIPQLYIQFRVEQPTDRLENHRRLPGERKREKKLMPMSIIATRGFSCQSQTGRATPRAVKPTST